MKFISVRNLAQGAALVIKRFPLEVLFAVTGTIAGIINIELSDLNYAKQSWCWRITAGANLGLLLSLAATLYAESKFWPTGKKWLLRLAAALITVGIVATINPFELTTDAIRFFLLSFAFHLLVSFAAFTGKSSVQGFWQFNKTLFLQFLTSVLYSAVLFLGLAAAIGAANFLFNLKFEWDTFAVLWTCIVGIFSVMFFLSGVPAQTDTLADDYSYPKALKVFTQYVLIPLATVYMLILLAYEIKIVAEWHLPKGLVSSLILGYSVFGILSILLVYPIRNQEDNKWIKTYAKSFYLLLLPLLALLFVACGARVFKYGITEFRYFLMLLAFWLLFASIYFSVSARQNIKLIPITLCILTLLAVYGPQSVFSVSKQSQLNILKKVFEHNNAFKNGALQPASAKISKKDGNRAVAVIRYLVEHHDLTALQPYFKQNLAHVSDSLAKLDSKWNGNEIRSRYELRNEKNEWLKKQLNLEQFSGYYVADEDLDTTTEGTTQASKNVLIEAQDQAVTSSRGYDMIIDLNSVSSYAHSNGDTTYYTLPTDSTMLRYINHDRENYEFVIDGKPVIFNLRGFANGVIKIAQKPGLSKNIKIISEQYSTKYIFPEDMLALTKKAGRFELTLKVKKLSIDSYDSKGTTYIGAVDALLMIKESGLR